MQKQLFNAFKNGSLATTLRNLTNSRALVCLTSNNYSTSTTQDVTDKYMTSFKTYTNKKKSYASSVITDFHLLSETIGERIQLSAEQRPNELCYVFPHNGDLRLTFKEVEQRVNTMAQNLLNLGFQKGDRITFILPNTVEQVIGVLACASIGCISAVLNIGYQSVEVEYMLKKTGSKGVVIYDSFKTLKHLDILNQICPELQNSAPGELKSAKLPDLKHVFVVNSPFSQTKQAYKGTWSYDSLVNPRPGNKKMDIPYVDPDDPVFILFTSGTTGFPKGALMKHLGIVNAINIFNHVPLGGAGWGVRCIPIPLFHIFGLQCGVIAPLVNAQHSVFSFYLPESVSILKALQNYKCTSLLGPPTILIDLMNHPDRSKYDLSSLKTILLGASTVPPDLIRKAKAEMKAENMIIGYGMTETSLGHTFTTSHDFKLCEKRAYESIGKPFPFTETKIIDPKTNQIVDLGTDGEVCMRGFNVIPEYWDEPKKTAETIDKQKWLHTGDICRMDADGYLFFQSRSKDLIIRGGVNVYPAEVEAFLRTHPKVIDVNVVGVPDERIGEEICAWFKLKPNETLSIEEVKQFCEGKIAYFKIPKYLKIVDAFPINASGKVLKHKIVEMARADLKL